MTVIDIEDHRPVWMTVRERCPCGKTCIGTVHAASNLDALECAGCGQMTSAVTHILCAGGRWEQRLATVHAIGGVR